jgi:hypothetical protein
MTTKVALILFMLTILGVSFIGVGVFSIRHFNQLSHERLTEEIARIHELEAEKRKGRRATYCDHVKHLVKDHGYDKMLLIDCANSPITDIDKLIYGGMTY